MRERWAGLPTWGKAVVVVVAVAVVGGPAGVWDEPDGELAAEDVEQSDEPEEPAEPSEPPEPSEQPPEVSDQAIEATEGFFVEETQIDDVSVLVEDGTISIAMQVGAATDPEWAREQLDNAARMLATMNEDGLDGPSADDLGGLYDHYTLHVGAGTGPDDMMVQGAKVPSSPSISW